MVCGYIRVVKEWVEDCKLTTKVLAQESTIRNLAGVVEDLLGRLAALEQPPSGISIGHTRTDSSPMGTSSASHPSLQNLSR